MRFRFIWATWGPAWRRRTCSNQGCWNHGGRLQGLTTEVSPLQGEPWRLRTAATGELRPLLPVLQPPLTKNRLKPPATGGQSPGGEGPPCTHPYTVPAAGAHGAITLLRSLGPHLNQASLGPHLNQASKNDYMPALNEPPSPLLSLFWLLGIPPFLSYGRKMGTIFIKLVHILDLILKIKTKLKVL